MKSSGMILGPPGRCVAHGPTVLALRPTNVQNYLASTTSLSKIHFVAQSEGGGPVQAPVWMVERGVGAHTGEGMVRAL